MLPAPRTDRTAATDEKAEALAHAAELVEASKAQRAQLETMLAEAPRALKDAIAKSNYWDWILRRPRMIETLAADLETRRQEVAICGPFF